MIISEQWLRQDWVDPSIDTETLSHQLTMAGLEVDSVAPVAGSFSGVIVAEIVAAEQHPNADKLRLCEVDTGDGRVQIVCGAPNARVGLKAPLAQVGAVLPGDFKIKKAKLRGVESRGMLCAEAELELSEENAGLMELASDAPVGADLRDYLSLDDNAIEIGLTPNRADCLGLAGVAREVAVLNGLAVKNPLGGSIAATIDDDFPIRIEAPEQCPRYLGRVIRSIDLSRPSPRYMVERLRRCGLRSIDPVVDVTNYVMLELGQPLHAFDLQSLSGGIVVREARSEERITLLDGSDVALSPGTLLIADEERPLAMAGIMGGENSGVSESTTDLFLESAFFAPEPIAGRARSYGLHTDASHRYERGVDPELQRVAIERATELLLEIVGGEAGPVSEKTAAEYLPTATPVLLRPARIARVLGFEMDAAEVESILTGLGFSVTSDTEGWHCAAPSWRFDIEQEVDLIEELARVYGYNRLPVSRIHAALNFAPQPEARKPLTRLKHELAARGFTEAITYSFVPSDLQSAFDPEVTPVGLRNPISSEMTVMRTSLIPGLLKVLSHNRNRQASRQRFFEAGLRFLPGESLDQQPMVALAMTGLRDSESWTSTTEPVDFYDMKAAIEMLFGHREHSPLSFVQIERPGLHPGQTAEVHVDGQAAGVLGAVHPSIADLLDLPAATFVAELDQRLLMATSLPEAQEVSRYPSVRRDLALLMEHTVPASALMRVAAESAGAYLDDVVVFDVYSGAGVGEDQKSLAIGLTFRHPERTLSDSEISEAMTQVIDSLGEKLNVKLRS
ncbi:phenylalanyl-tRNA synthetase, beta subunit [Luminiphilus syltensis NOR5-1B]|uniref:Phenylalanine--tRNA ligase beta subunit n=1 Tax=Luminiphilus syltensis NOR5-1B TaxID=565045 RepID=B8KX93_9GAMM|nr:phenylalanine--tRNA ligase subunit beta [Luminiphilus syltensis]EED35369.1 phenylalanyl-tRNA synthetase, beta subunit [Luminiphilus syltensis NOR5-1B]